MGFFDFLKKKSEIANETQVKAEQGFDKLTNEGDLPFGWIYRNKEFTNKIQSEYSHFLNMWLDSSRNGSPKEQYAALKSFVMYLEDAEKLCVSKGECFEFWFYEIIASSDYINKRKIELLQISNDTERR